MLWDVFADSLKDVIKMIPMMFLVSVLGEFAVGKIATRTHRPGAIVNVLGASFLGLVPQCGVSVGFAKLYAEKRVGLALLIAVFLSSSDEALIIAAGSYDFASLTRLVLIKLLIASFFGVIILLCEKNGTKAAIPEKCTPRALPIGELLRKSAHSILRISTYVFVTVFVLNLLIESVGIESLQEKINSVGFLQVLAVSLIGLVPSCASSAFITESYINGIISFGALVGGLCANTGFGIIVIFKTLSLRQALKVTLLLLGISAFSGTCIFMLSES